MQRTESADLGECPRAKGQAGKALAQNAAYLLNHAAIAARSIYAAALEPLGLSPRQLAVLLLLADQEPLRQHELASTLGIDQTTMVQMVDELETAGRVIREKDPADRRAYALYLTATGHESLAAALVAEKSAQDQLLHGLDDQEREQFLRLLRKLHP
ncbi:MAG: MarR family winged helix-turn-helix transcriptional regulator [Capsulimonadaceae bacterium]